MDIFQKCRNLQRIEEARQMGIYPYFHPIEDVIDGVEVIMNGRRVIMAGSNNYLGLSYDPRVKEAAISAIRKYGTSSSGSRFLNGTLKLHIELEEELAEFVGKESAIAFSTGFQVNQGAIVPLIGKGDYVISDKDNHSSIVQGCLIVSGLWKRNNNFLRYNNNDPRHLEEVLSSLGDGGKLVVTDGVFSMTGIVANLPAIVDVAKKYSARVMVDDAHGFGVLGKGGRGTANYFGIDDKVDLIMSTFSKSLGSLGGFIAGEKDVIEYIRHNSPAFIFSASISPPNVAAAKKSLEIIKEEPERIDHLLRISNILRQGLKEIGLKTIDGITPIIPVILGDDMKVLLMWRALFDEGVYVNAVLGQAAPPGMQLLRITLTANHTEKHVEIILEKFEKISKKFFYDNGIEDNRKSSS